jgi:hypothetical protein
MEIAAAPAPRAQILVAASGDWTKTTMTVEGPAIERIYKLFNAEDKFRYALFDFDHNYNQTTREAVYDAFGKWLLNHRDPSSLKETAYEMEPVDSLRVFPDGKLPENALNETQLIGYLVERVKAQFTALLPRDQRTLDQFKRTIEPAWRHTLQIEFPEKLLLVEAGETKKIGDVTRHSLAIGRRDRGDRLPMIMLTPSRDNLRVITVLAHPHGKAAYLEESGVPRGLARELLARHQSVILLDTFLMGELADTEAVKARKHTSGYFTTYNRTDLQERVQDLITACAFAQTHGKGRRVVLCGEERAGLWALLAARAADAVVADCAQLDSASDAALLEQDLFAPGLRVIGGFDGAALLAAPNSLVLHNTGEKFTTSALGQSYAALKKKSSFRTESKILNATAQADYIAQLKFQ